jgi:hypothetical protein
MSLIGISGPARSGKDTLGQCIVDILSERGINCEKTSLARQLKEECKDFLLDTIGIDSFTEKDEEKQIIRPLLVTWGTHVRRKLDPDVWIKSVEKKRKQNCVTIVSDIRFRNEFDWIKDNGGYVIFVDRVLPNGSKIQAANKDEEENTMPLREIADHSFTWDTIDNEQWLAAISYEVLVNTVPEEKIKSWIQTCH